MAVRAWGLCISAVLLLASFVAGASSIHPRAAAESGQGLRAVGYLQPASHDGVSYANVDHLAVTRRCRDGSCVVSLSSGDRTLDTRVFLASEPVSVREGDTAPWATLDRGGNAATVRVTPPTPTPSLVSLLAVLLAAGALGMQLAMLVWAAGRRAFVSRARPCVVGPGGIVLFTDGRYPFRGFTRGIVPLGEALARESGFAVQPSYREDGTVEVHEVLPGARNAHVHTLDTVRASVGICTLLGLVAILVPLAQLLG